MTDETEKRKAPKASSNYMGPVLFGFAVIFLTFGVAGGWAAIAPLGSAVLAPGVVVVDNNRKAVQHLEGGLISEIDVVDGQFVKEGDVLFRLDVTQAQANNTLIAQQLHAAQILEARLRAEREELDEIVLPEELKNLLSDPVVARAMQDEEVQFKERLASIRGQVDILESRIAQSNNRIDGLNVELKSTREQIDFINMELVGVRDLHEKGLVPSTRLNSLERERARLEGVIGRTVAEISGTQSVIGESRLQIAQLRQQHLEDVAKQVTEARKTINELKERLIVSSDILRRTAILAPRSGRVIGLKVFTVGQVVRAGDTLLEIVPKNEGFVVNAQISPLDIDAVTPNMSAEVRFSAFKARTTPVVFGSLKEVSPDRIVDEKNGQPYFLARVIVAEEEIPEALKGRITAGMPADVILPTGERTVLQYLLNPLETALSQSFAEE